MRHVLLRIPAIERLYPHDRGGLRWDPAKLPWPGLHAAERHTLRKGQARDLVDQHSRRVPNLHFLWKLARGMKVREGPMCPRHQNVLAVRRRSHAFQQPWLADRRDRAGRSVDLCQLRRRIVFERSSSCGFWSMSSYVGTGPAWPRLSWMSGPFGTGG